LLHRRTYCRNLPYSPPLGILPWILLLAVQVNGDAGQPKEIRTAPLGIHTCHILVRMRMRRFSGSRLRSRRVHIYVDQAGRSHKTSHWAASRRSGRWPTVICASFNTSSQ
jgi:hypothetical protein